MIPTTKKEIEALGWDVPDIILFTGDAFIDHPAFGAAVIARVLENAGYRVAVVPQPNWRDDLRDFKNLDDRNFFLVSPPVQWTRWSITIPLQNVCAVMMPILPAVKLRSDQIMQ